MEDNIERACKNWKQELERSICYQRLIAGEEELFWEQYAETYYQNRTSGPHHTEVLECLLKMIPEGSELVEIGPGPGVFTLPLAGHCSSLTVVEPSPAVIKALRRKTTHLSNLRIIHDSWEGVSMGSYDIVFAGGVLYAFYDLKSALYKMMLHARQKVILVTMEEEQSLLKELATLLHLQLLEGACPSTAVILDILKHLTSSFRCRRLTGHQQYRYPDWSAFLYIWNHGLRLIPEHIPQIQSLIVERGGSVNAGGEITVPRLLNTFVIEVDTQ